ncbi:hypothetical protein QYE76_000695 [Lolium multiflorum]|uniref:TF-B3 domain-containing protein n=1 Tax=Lolium multiflorum TaxID=4521 RepID=A0AAD8RKE8_LOLMU|nr:hypothetical protein QYE76_000695 [Lolium multiflorum]
MRRPRRRRGPGDGLGGGRRRDGLGRHGLGGDRLGRRRRAFFFSIAGRVACVRRLGFFDLEKLMGRSASPSHIHLIHCHGFHASTRTGKGKGKGKGSGSSSLPPPPSTLPLIIEEFFIVVYEDPLVKKALPKIFADYLDGQEPAKVYLRAADCGPRLWTVEVLFDGQGRMYLDKGWEKFAIAHGVDLGGRRHIKNEGDDVLTVKVFDGTMCRRYYYSDDEDNDDESDDDVKPCIHPL